MLPANQDQICEVREILKEEVSRGETESAHKARIRRGVVYTLIGGLFWGLNGTASKWLMDTYAIDPLWLVCIRQMFACWLFLGAAALTREGRTQLGAVLKSPQNLFSVFMVGLVAVLTSQVSYLSAINWTNSATATIMQSLGMLLVLLWICFDKRRLPRLKETVGIILALCGTFLVATAGDPTRMNLPLEGLLWGIACAAAAAGLAIVPKKPIERHGNFVVNGLAFLLSGILIVLWYRPWEHMPTLDLVGVLMVAACIVIGTFGAYALYLQGVKDAGPMRASLLGTIEPIAATVATVFLLQTSISVPELIGFALIMGMVYLTA